LAVVVLSLTNLLNPVVATEELQVVNDLRKETNLLLRSPFLLCRYISKQL